MSNIGLEELMEKHNSLLRSVNDRLDTLIERHDFLLGFVEDLIFDDMIPRTEYYTELHKKYYMYFHPDVDPNEYVTDPDSDLDTYIPHEED